MMNSKKIYIIGTVASGKTTLAKHLSSKLNIKYYSLDKVVWDDENNNTKRNKNEINKIFKGILKKDSWIIEDVGRKNFYQGREEADIIYFLSLKKSTIYFRVLKRWIKQKLNIEKYDYKPTIYSLFEMFSWAKSDIEKRNEKIKELELYKDKLVILKEKELNHMYKKI